MPLPEHGYIHAYLINSHLIRSWFGLQVNPGTLEKWSDRSYALVIEVSGVESAGGQRGVWRGASKFNPTSTKDFNEFTAVSQQESLKYIISISLYI
jgi:hypothetical protein